MLYAWCSMMVQHDGAVVITVTSQQEVLGFKPQNASEIPNEVTMTLKNTIKQMCCSSVENI